MQQIHVPLGLRLSVTDVIYVKRSKFSDTAIKKKKRSKIKKVDKFILVVSKWGMK